MFRAVRLQIGYVWGVFERHELDQAKHRELDEDYFSLPLVVSGFSWSLEFLGGLRPPRKIDSKDIISITSV